MPVDSLDEAITRANDTEFGLDRRALRRHRGRDRGVLRPDRGRRDLRQSRKPGATTGAWPDVQSFGGWKGSGTSGTGGGGPYYLRQYMREQSRTRVRN